MCENNTWGVRWSVIGTCMGVRTAHVGGQVECCRNVHVCENNTHGVSGEVL